MEAPGTESLKSQRLTTNLRSQRLISSQRFDGLQRSQSLQSQRLETNQGASRSSETSQRLTGRATHLTKVTGLPAAAGSKRLAAPKGRFSTHRVARPKGVLSLTEAHRAVRKVRSTRRRSLGTHSCYPRRDGQVEGMITRLGNGVSELSANMHSIFPCPKKTHGRGH